MPSGPSPFWRIATVAVLKPLLTLLTRRQWRGLENVPRQGGMILAANHLSWADPLVVAHFTYDSGRWPMFLAKSGMFDVPVLGRLLRKLGQVPVYRHSADAALVLGDAEKAVRTGACLIFYPEGTCTRDPNLWPMVAKTGVARLALSTGVPVIPLAHWGAQHILPYGTKRPRLLPPKKVQVVAGPPVDLSAYEGQPLTADTLRAATATVMKAITDLLAGIRAEQPPGEPFDWYRQRRLDRERQRRPA